MATRISLHNGHAAPNHGSFISTETTNWGFSKFHLCSRIVVWVFSPYIKSLTYLSKVLDWFSRSHRFPQTPPSIVDHDESEIRSSSWIFGFRPLLLSFPWWGSHLTLANRTTSFYSQQHSQSLSNHMEPFPNLTLWQEQKTVSRLPAWKGCGGHKKIPADVLSASRDFWSPQKTCHVEEPSMTFKGEVHIYSKIIKKSSQQGLAYSEHLPPRCHVF